MAKTALISGTSSGIGEATVRRLARAGWTVYAGVRRTIDGERVVSSCPGDVRPIELDVTVGEQIAEAVARIERDVGRLDGLVNNAGIGVGGPVEMLSEDGWRWQMEVNFFGLVNLTRAAFPLVDKANGRFVHVGSIAGRITSPSLGAYSASKHAVSAFNWALRSELGRTTGMQSSVVEPGEIRTDIWDKADDAVDEFERTLTPRDRARYGHLLPQQRAFVNEGRTKGVEADKVAQAIEKALTAKRPKARYLVGPDAHMMGIVTRLPDPVRELAIRANCRRLERAGKKITTR